MTKKTEENKGPDGATNTVKPPNQSPQTDTVQGKAREVTGHEVKEVGHQLQILAVDAPGPGGANHAYQICDVPPEGKPQAVVGQINFQKGGVKDVDNPGVNGVTEKALLAIVADRLRAFQAGKFACRENRDALIKIESALERLHRRTRDRVKRGVQGLSKA